MLTWFAQIIRSFFFWIDYNLFGFIETLYNLLIDISRTTILTQGDIKEFASRVQMLLGVFMLFKVAFSIITYVINPDEMTDKSKGLAKLGQNAIISLVLLVVTPYIFGMAYDLQIMVLEDNTIASLIFGSTDDDTFIETGGQKLSFSVMIPFFRPDTGLPELSSCRNLYEPGTNSTVFNNDCYTALVSSISDDKNNEIDDRIIGNYTTGVSLKNFGLTFRSEAVTFLSNNNQFIFDYKIILSTAAAVVVILILLTYAMDVALRSVKLAFLQLISPIPIISYIDPKQGKDGMFKKWYTMCFSTYISLFIRLLALYFGLYLIDIVISKGFSDVVTGQSVDAGWFNTGMWISLFMIIGILMFIKQLPKILEGFGIKLDGGGKFTLNPFKKFENEAFGGKQILGAGAALGAGALSGATNIATNLPSSGRALRNMFNKDYWKNSDGDVSVGSVLKGAGRGIHGVFTPVRSGIAGTSSGIFRGMKKTIKGEKPGKIFADSYGEAMFSKLIRKDNLRKANLENASLGERIKFAAGSFGADVARYMGVLNEGQQEYLTADQQDKQIAELQSKNAELKVAQEKLRDAKFSAFEEIQGIGKNIDSLLEKNSAVKTAKTAWENAKARGESNEEIEKMRQAYKLKKAEILQKENANANSAIHDQVELYNKLRSKAISDGKITAAQKYKFVELSTDIKFKADTNGNYVTVGSDYYEIHEDAYGVDYYVDSSGRRVYQPDWSSLGATRSKVDKSGVSIIGDNDDMVDTEKITFESSAEYKGYTDSIKQNEREIDAIKASAEYIQAHDENSIHKLENASRFNQQVQQPGYKPASGPAQGTPFRGLYNPPMSNGATPLGGGTPPPGGGTPPPGGGTPPPGGGTPPPGGAGTP